MLVTLLGLCTGVVCACGDGVECEAHSISDGIVPVYQLGILLLPFLLLLFTTIIFISSRSRFHCFRCPQSAQYRRRNGVVVVIVVVVVGIVVIVELAEAHFLF